MSDELHVQVNEAQLHDLLDPESTTETIRVSDSNAMPNTTPISEAQLDETHDLLGIVRQVNDVNTFDRDNGEEGQVRNVRIQDRTGTLRLALWGEHADRNLSVGDALHVTGVEIQDGYQDTFEGSVGWDSTLLVVDDAAEADTYVTITLDEPDTEES